MFKNNKFAIFFFICVLFLECNPGSKETKLKFESVSSSFYSPDNDYRKALYQWKNYYEQCTKEQLFADAYYLQLQDKIYIGSINNEHEIDVSKGIHLLDTSGNGNTFNRNIFNLLSITNISNCNDTINLTTNLKESFYREVLNALNATPEYKSLTAVIDTGQMKIKISTIGTNALMPDSLINVLNTTKDSSLLRFKELLLKPENVMLAQTVEVLGFSAEFPLKSRLSATQEKQLTNEAFFNFNNSNDKGSIKLISNNSLRIQINKRYTVLGRFLKLKTS